MALSTRLLQLFSHFLLLPMGQTLRQCNGPMSKSRILILRYQAIKMIQTTMTRDT